MDRRIGTRELRADLAAQLRRAGSGHRVVITSGGRPVAALGPAEAARDDTGAASLDALVAVGAVIPPRRIGAATRFDPVHVWTGVRLDRALREVRG